MSSLDVIYEQFRAQGHRLTPQRRAIIQPHLIDPVLVAVERKYLTTTVDPGGFHGIEEYIGCQGSKRLLIRFRFYHLTTTHI